MSLKTFPGPTTSKKPATVKVAMFSARHRWPIFGLWFVFTLGLMVVSLAMGGLNTSNPGGNATTENQIESKKAFEVFNAGSKPNPNQDTIILVSNPTVKNTDPAFKSQVAAIAQKLREITFSMDGTNLPSFSRVVDPFTIPPALATGLISGDGTTVRIVATIQGDSAERRKKIVPVKPVIDSLKTTNNGYQILALNNTLFNDDINELVSKDLDGSLRLTLPLTFIILLIAFGTIVASVVPLVLAVTALIGAFGFLGIYSQVVGPVSSYATQLIVLIGLAVAVDYSLFMVTRFRTERRRGRDKMAAIEVASSTAGRAVFFSGITVMISLAGLFILNDSLFKSMATGTIGVVLISVIGSLTFLPATLAILGNGVNWGRLPFFGRDREEGSGFWGKLVTGVMKRPLVYSFLTVAFLLALGFPVLHLRLGISDVESFPDKLEGVQAIRLMNEKWPQGTTLKEYVMVTQANRPEVRAAVDKFREDALKIPGFHEPSEVTMAQNGTVARVSFVLGGLMNDKSNLDLVAKTRQELVPAYFKNLPGVEAYVAGDPATVVDVVKTYTDAMPLVFGFVLGLSFLLLLVAFHSIVIPIKAIILNLFSTAASYGAMVLVFQDGWFGQQLGIKPTGIIESWVPVFIFTILFGLSMDYHLFILTRIKELKDRGLNTLEAVAKGISLTSGTITSAASIMVVVFAVFVTLQLVIIRQLGLGLAVAVFIDATLIRCILLPATMRLLGEWNWYIPKFLEWIPQITIEGEDLAEAQPESLENPTSKPELTRAP